MTKGANDSGFLTNAGLQSTDIAKIRQLIMEVVGDPRIGSFLGDAFQKAVGPMLTSSVNLYGGASLPYGSSALFGPRNSGAEFMRWAQDQGIQATMNESSRVVRDLRMQQNMDYLTAFGGAATEDQARAMAQRFTFTGLASNFMFAQMQPGALQRGLEEGSRYLGAGGLGFDEMTQENRRNASTMATAVTSDYLSNPQMYYGLKGADVGRLYAEMGRTGQLGRIRRENEGMFGPGGMEGSVITATREAARSIQAFRQIFRGSVTDVLDQVNALMGTDVMATFDDQGRSLMQNMSAAGAIAGFAPQQMAALGGMSRRISMAAGLDPWGSASSATYAAQLIGTQRQAGIASPLVSEVDFRADVLRRTTGAQQSGLSRDISGAYALIAQTNQAAADQFLATVRGMDPNEAMRLDPSRLSQMVRGAVGGDVSGFDIRDASFTKAAEIARAEGVGTRIAARHNAGSIQSTRMAMLQSQLRGSGADIRAVLRSIGSGPVTEDRITTALRAGGLDTAAATTTTGALMRRFELQADALGFRGGARGVDQFLAATYETERMRSIIEQTEGGAKMLELLGGRNVSGGVVGVNQYIKNLSRGGEGSIRGFIDAALGGAGRNLSADEAMKMFRSFEGGSKELETYLGKTLTGRQQGTQGMVRMGANIALKTLFTKQFKGQVATKEQIERARDLISNFDEEDMSGLVDYAEEATGGGFEFETAKNIFDLQKLMGDDVKFKDDEAFRDAAEAMTVMEQVIAKDIKFKSKDLAGKDNKEATRFKSTSKRLLEAYQEKVKGTAKGDTVQSFEGFKKTWQGWKEKGAMDRKKYEELMEAEQKANEEIGPPGSTAKGLDRIIDLLGQIVTHVLEGGLGKKTADASASKGST